MKRRNTIRWETVFDYQVLICRGSDTMGMSDRIEAFILELMKQEQEEWLKIQRNELAQIFGCVPSQINYVIATRFNPERGYMVESKRGGGGCVMIRRTNDVMTIADDLTENESRAIIKELYNRSVISQREAELIRSATDTAALINVGDKNRVRADILKNMLRSTIKKEEVL